MTRFLARTCLSAAAVAAAVVALVVLSGCASTAFENRIMTTLAGDRAQAALYFGSFSVGLDLSAEDAAELAKLRRQAGLAAAGFTGK